MPDKTVVFKQGCFALGTGVSVVLLALSVFTGNPLAALVFGLVAALGLCLFEERIAVYFEPRDWWIGYYRGDTHHYVCPLPTMVIRWERQLLLLCDDPTCYRYKQKHGPGPLDHYHDIGAP